MCDYRIKTLFFYGTNSDVWASEHASELKNENDNYGDIVALREHTESYEKLTEKTMRMLRHVNQTLCTNYRFYFKGDDNTELLLPVLWKVRFASV